MSGLQANATSAHAPWKHNSEAARAAEAAWSAAQQRAVVYERQYRKLRLILLALRDDDSPFGRGGLPVDMIISYLVPWRVSN